MLLIGFNIYSKTFPNYVLAKIQLHLIGLLLRQFQILSKPNFNCISSELFYDNIKLCLGENSIASHRNFFYDNSKLCLSPNSIASHRNSSKMIPNVVSAKNQLHLIGSNLRQFQILFEPNFKCISSDSLFILRQFQILLSQFSIASHRNWFKAIPNFVCAKNQLLLIGIIVRQFHILSEPKVNCF